MLTSVRNPLVKQFRKLHQSKERQRHGLFLLEGTHLLEEAHASKVEFVAVCYTAAWQKSHTNLCQDVAAQAQRVELVTDAVLSAIATTVHPNGVVAIAHYPANSSLAPSLQAHADASFLGVAVETLQDPGNLGTIIRTAAAVGIDGLWTSQNSVDLTHPKVLRASAGQWFRLPMEANADVSTVISQLQSGCEDGPLQVIATCPDTTMSYWDVDYTKPSLILIGNEGAGLSQQLLAIATHHIQIPLSPDVESLNAAIATALILYEAKRQRNERMRTMMNCPEPSKC